jgi:acyl-CoA thioesterase-1
MSQVVYVFGSGLAYFLGGGFILTAMLLASAERKPSLRMLGRLAAVVGLVFVALSAVPFPWWVLGGLACLLLAWAIAEALLAGRPGWRRLVRWSVALARLSAAAVELPYHFTPRIEAPGRPELWVVADSVTAGLGDSKTVLWPRILANQRHIIVHDRWQMGATVASAYRKLQKEPLGDGIVLLEIGGNDLLGSTKVADFEDQLEQLLAHVCRHGRTVVMFELPLPPLCNEWGLIQRRLAAKYAVVLIPKRIFIGLLSPDDMTVDGIHLSQHGHEAMADTVWRLLHQVYKN